MRNCLRNNWRRGRLCFVCDRFVVIILDGKSKTHYGNIESGRPPIDSRAILAVPNRSIFLRQAACRVRVRHHQKSKMPDGINHRAFCSGDVLLSRGLSPYYHRGCSVSLPCSKWERVGPLRYYHQSAEPHWQFAAVAATQARSRISGDFCQSSLPKFRKNRIFDRQSQVENLYQFPGIYIQEEECDSRFIITIHELNELRFV